MTAAAFPLLVFRRTLGGQYEATPEGAATEFHALITAVPEGWYIHLSVFGRTLEAATRPTLNEARDYARNVYTVVETGAR